MKLKYKLALFALLCSVLPLLGVSTLAFEAARDSLRDLVQAELLAVAAREQSRLQRALDESLANLKHWSNLSIMQDVLSDDEEGDAQRELLRLKRDYPVFTELMALNDNGIVVSTTSDRERCLAVGMDDYLSKPVQSHQLRNTLQGWLASQNEKSCAADTRDLPVVDGVFESKPPAVAPGAHHLLHALESSTLDPTVLADIRALGGDGGARFLRRVVDAFADGTKEDLQRLQTAIAAANAEEAREAAHRLKASSGTVGARHLASLIDLEVIVHRQPVASSSRSQWRIERRRAYEASFFHARCPKSRACGRRQRVRT